MVDINFVLDTLLERVKSEADGVYRLIDPEQIGVMGHSLGGSAALGIPRQRNDVDVIIALESPILYDIVGVEKEKFVMTEDDYPVPVLNIYSDSSWGYLSEWPQYARNYEFLSNFKEPVFHIHLAGAGHFSLTDLSLVSPCLVRFFEGSKSTKNPEDFLREVNKACLVFFDRNLKGK